MNLQTTIQKKLEEGAYTARLAKYDNVENEKGGYIKVTFKLDDREISEVIFPSSANYFFGCLRKQLGLEEEDTTYEELLELAQKKDIKLWISYNNYGRNVAYHEPVVKEEVNITNVAV